jgi:hypothetical protein
MGGLGNQLFQIAFGVSVERALGRPVWFDSSFYSLPTAATPRQLEVDLSALGLRELRAPRALRGAMRLVRPPLRIIETTGTVMRVADVRPLTVWAVGYQQSPESPLQAVDAIVEALRIHTSPQPHIGSHVAVHVRLGDYAERPDTRSFHGVTDPHWSIDQARTMASQLGVHRLQIFTDSPQLLTEILGSELGADVDIDTSNSAWEVLSAMRAADGIVMTNSSLSWWAAFIATHIDQRQVPVIMPKPWFAEPSPADFAMAAPGWNVLPRTLWIDA